MIENITGYLVVTACFLLMFFLFFLMGVQYKESIFDFLEKSSRFSTKKPDNKMSNILFAWGNILFLRKLIYYVPLEGVIQTKFSVWWMREDILIFQAYILALFLLGIFILGVIIGFFSKPLERFDWAVIFFPVFAFIMGIRGIWLLLKELNIEYMPFDQIMYTPVLFLKMLCSGKYLGILTSLAVGYYILNRHKKMKLKINKRTIKYLKTPGIIILVLLIISFYIFPGDWEDRFEQKCRASISQYTFEELMDAANSISDNTDKSNTLKILALSIAERGNFPWAASVARSIPDEEIKNKALEEIRQRIKKK